MKTMGWAPPILKANVSDLEYTHLIGDLELLREDIDCILLSNELLSADLRSELKDLRMSMSKILAAILADLDSAFSRPA
jgi:hypothetical protein